jgi:hypothetical protein
MTARRDPDRLIQAFLDEGQAELPDRAYDAVRAEIDQTRQRVVIGPWRVPNMSNIGRFAMAAAAVLVVAVVGVFFLSRPGGVGGPQPSPTPTQNQTSSPIPSASPVALYTGALEAGTYTVTPYSPSSGGHDCLEPPQPGCTESPANDSIRFTFSVPDGWAGFESAIWPATVQNLSPRGAGMSFDGGAPWLYSDPCDAIRPPDIPVGPTVDDFASALADHPLLDVTNPVDVTLGGYSGKYVNLQVPSDISACTDNLYRPWEPGIYAQGPSHRWHLWILDVDGVRAVVMTYDYPETSQQHRAELQAIVDSIRIDP